MTHLSERLYEAMMEVLNLWFIKTLWGTTLPSLFFKNSILSPISNRQRLLKDSCARTLGSLKNDPLQSCFCALIIKSNIHEMDFPLCSPTNPRHRCMFAGAFRLCLHRLVRLAWVNGILKAHFQATQLITQG